MDTLTTQQRSERMSRIRGKDTQPELVVRRSLHQSGYRFRLHRRDLPGAPDLVFPCRKKVVFVHGCFWHAHDGCRIANKPKSRRSYWSEKFARNQERDAANERLLREGGWHVFVVWECETKDQERLLDRLSKYLGPPKRSVVVGGRHGRR